MKITTKKLSELRKPEKNVRIHTEQQLREFERSVKMFGQIRPIVIDENTLLRLEYEEAEVYQYFDLTENQKKKLMIADNKIFSLGIENLDTLNSFLEDLHDDLDIPGYDSEILKQMVSEADDITEKLSSYGTLDDEEIKAIKEKNEKASLPEHGEENPNTGVAYTASEVPLQSAGDTDNGEDGEAADVKKFVICPKCGEKIWL